MTTNETLFEDGFDPVTAPVTPPQTTRAERDRLRADKSRRARHAYWSAAVALQAPVEPREATPAVFEQCKAAARSAARRAN